MNNYQIEDYNLIKTDIIKSISIILLNIELKKKAIFKVELNDTNNNCCKTEYITVENEDYLNWYNNDDYIVQYILNKLNLKLK